AVSAAGTIAVADTATVSFGGSYTVAGTTAVNGGSASFPNPATSTTLNESGGSIGGTATLTVSGSLEWSGGTQTGVGETLLAAGASATIDPVGEVLLSGGRLFENDGSLAWTGGNIDLRDPSVTVENRGRVDIRGDGYLYSCCSGGGLVHNGAAGTISKSGGSSSGVYVALDNDGVLRADQGTLSLRGGDGGGSDSGSYSAAARPTLAF